MVRRARARDPDRADGAIHARTAQRQRAESGARLCVGRAASRAGARLAPAEAVAGSDGRSPGWQATRADGALVGGAWLGMRPTAGTTPRCRMTMPDCRSSSVCPPIRSSAGSASRPCRLPGIGATSASSRLRRGCRCCRAPGPSTRRARRNWSRPLKPRWSHAVSSSWRRRRQERRSRSRSSRSPSTRSRRESGCDAAGTAR